MSSNNRQKRLKILFTEGSSTSAREALYCLGPQHAIDILDPSPFCQCRFSRCVRRWYRCPSYSNDPLGYLRFLVRRLRSEQYDVLLPTHEQLYLLSRVRDRLQEHTGLVVNEFAGLDKVINKANLSRLLTELDIPQPRTEIAATREQLESCVRSAMPCYLKPDFGTAGRGVYLVGNEDELQFALEQYENAGLFADKQEILVQQPAIGEQEDVGGLFQHGRLISAGGCRARMRGVGGAPMGRVSLHRPDIVEHVRRIGEHLRWHGPISFGIFYSVETGRAEFIDCNPRIGETVHPLLCGINACELVVQMALGQSVEAPPPPRDGVLTHQGFLILLSKALAGEGRLAVLREWWRQRRGQGFYADSEDELTRPREDWLSLIPAAAVTLLMLTMPGTANWLVNRTVRNYSLSGSAAQRIANLTDEELASCFD